jgi:hypothetical protein
MFRIDVGGVQAVRAKLDRIAQRIPDRVGNALYAEAEIEMGEAKRRTPVDTGALRASGHVGFPVFEGRDIAVTLNFGGPAAPYALVVHEDLGAWHAVGQAKYLESTLLESAPFLPTRIATRLMASGFGLGD